MRPASEEWLGADQGRRPVNGFHPPPSLVRRRRPVGLCTRPTKRCASQHATKVRLFHAVGFEVLYSVVYSTCIPRSSSDSGSSRPTSNDAPGGRSWPPSRPASSVTGKSSEPRPLRQTSPERRCRRPLRRAYHSPGHERRCHHLGIGPQQKCCEKGSDQTGGREHIVQPEKGVEPCGLTASFRFSGKQRIHLSYFSDLQVRHKTGPHACASPISVRYGYITRTQPGTDKGAVVR